MISIKQINSKYVTAIPIPNDDTRPIKGSDVCEEVYANIFLCAKKKSGKTSALFKIMKECMGRKTIIYIFCSTAYKDKNWIQIRKYFKKIGMEIHVFTSMFEDGQDQLSNLIENLKQKAKEEEEAKEQEEEEEEEEQEEEEEEEVPDNDRCDNILGQLNTMYLRSIGQAPPEDEQDEDEEEDEEPRRKERRSKYLAPEYMIIFDDLSSELKSKSLLSLLKFNRHFKSKLIISSQWLHDLLPESRKQIDLFLVFKGFPEKKMQEIYKDCDSGIPFETFLNMYQKATEKPHSFFYIDTRSDSFRCNFDSKFILHDTEINYLA